LYSRTEQSGRNWKEGTGKIKSEMIERRVIKGKSKRKDVLEDF
jgi:hypothetical protein